MCIFPIQLSGFSVSNQPGPELTFKRYLYILKVTELPSITIYNKLQFDKRFRTLIFDFKPLFSLQKNINYQKCVIEISKLLSILKNKFKFS